MVSIAESPRVHARKGSIALFETMASTLNSAQASLATRLFGSGSGFG